MFKKSLDYGQAGDNIGALLRGVKRDDVQRGQVLAQPNTVKTYKKFEVRRKIKFSTRHLVSAPVDTLLLNRRTVFQICIPPSISFMHCFDSRKHNIRSPNCHPNSKTNLILRICPILEFRRRSTF